MNPADVVVYKSAKDTVPIYWAGNNFTFSGYVGTGMVVYLYNPGNYGYPTDSITLVVDCDITGDGLCNMNDVNLINNYYHGINEYGVTVSGFALPLPTYAQQIAASCPGNPAVLIGNVGRMQINSGLFVPATSASITPSAYTVNVGDVILLTPTLNPTNAALSGFTWKSSNTAVAYVENQGDISGRIYGLSAGTATITATTTDGTNKSATCTVTVNNPVVPVTGVTLDTPFLGTWGNSYTLTATVAPSNATNQAVTWSSDNIAVATVDNTGKVTAISVGNANIICTTVDGNKTAICNVIVYPREVTGVQISYLTNLVPVGKSTALVAVVSPAGATNQSVTWSSSNTSVATVNGNGVVTAVALGSATIIATTVDGGFTDTCAITVVPAGSALIGDVNNDGVVDRADLDRFGQYISGADRSLDTFSLL